MLIVLYFLIVRNVYMHGHCMCVVMICAPDSGSVSLALDLPRVIVLCS